MLLQSSFERERRRQRREARQIFLPNYLVILYVSIFGEIPLTPASPSERNDGR